MSRKMFLYIGPYAEWLVPLGRTFWPTEPWPRPKVRSEEAKSWDRLLDGGQLDWALSEGEECPQVQVQGQTFGRVCAVPKEERSGRPDRPMLLIWSSTTPPGGPGQMMTDWTTLDRQAEVEWFRATFAAELAEVVRLSKLEPAFRWGLVYWHL